MPEKHTLSQFDDDLNHISSLVMDMGGVVELQLRQAAQALVNMDVQVADLVQEREAEVNHFEVQLDHEITSVISRRQPAARDLRLLMAMSRITSNLERAGDEVHRMARMVKLILESGLQRSLPAGELHAAAEMASVLLRRSLDAFARQDAHMALSIIKEDDALDNGGARPDSELRGVFVEELHVLVREAHAQLHTIMLPRVRKVGCRLRCRGAPP